MIVRRFRDCARLRRSLAGLFLIAGLSPPAFAQEAAEPTMPPPDAASDAAAVAVATKESADSPDDAEERRSPLRYVPLSVDSFSGERLRSVGGTDLQSALRFSPGVTVSPGMTGDSQQVIFRGVSTDTQASFATRTFGLIYDDVSLVNPTVPGGQPNLDPFDMAAVQVLKGPQGALFGPSALAGAVRYVPQFADYEAAYGTISGGVGSLARSGDMTEDYTAMWNQPFGESFAIRAVASRRDEAGYLRDIRNDRDNVNSSRTDQIRLLAGWRVTEDLELRLNGFRREYRLDDGTFADNTQRPTNSRRFVPEFVDSEISVGSLTAEWAFEPFSLRLTGSYLDKDFEQILDVSTFSGSAMAGAGTYASLPGNSRQPGAELSLLSQRPTQSELAILDGWEYVAGYAYTRSDQAFALDIGAQALGSLILQEVDAEAEEHALYLNLSRRLWESWSVGFGGRLLKQTTDAFSDVTVNALDSVLPLLPGVAVNHIEGRLKEEEFNPRVSLEWRVAQDFALFAAAVKGFRFGGINTNPTLDPQVPDFFKADSIWNYELGARSRWLGGNLQADLTLFYLDWDDVQIQQREYLGLLSYTDNLGGARSRGVELAIEALLPAGFALNLSGAYVDAETTEAFDDFQGPAPEGRELPGTPPFNGAARLSWAEAWDAIELSSAVTYTYQTRNYNNLAQTFEHPSLGLLGASVGLRFAGLFGAPELSLIGTNLTNELEPVLVTDALLTNDVLVVFNRPRELKLNLRLSF